MTTEAAITTRPPRKGFRLGLWGLICAVLAPVWAISAFYLGVWSGSGHDFPNQVSSLPEWATVPVYILVVTSFFVVPLSLVAALVLAILAIGRNLTLGRVLAIIGIIVAVLFVAGIVAVVLLFFGAVSSFT